MKVILEGKLPQNCFECIFGAANYTRLQFASGERRTYACYITGKAMTSTKRNRYCPLIDDEKENKPDD